MSIEISGLNFSYGSTDVLHGVSFTAADGDIAAVLGPNGVGKSTLFRCVLGFLDPTEGTVRVNGRDMRTLDRRAAAKVSPIFRSHACRRSTTRCLKLL